MNALYFLSLITTSTNRTLNPKSSFNISFSHTYISCTKTRKGLYTAFYLNFKILDLASSLANNSHTYSIQRLWLHWSQKDHTYIIAWTFLLQFSISRFALKKNSLRTSYQTLFFNHWLSRCMIVRIALQISSSWLSWLLVTSDYHKDLNCATC